MADKPHTAVQARLLIIEARRKAVGRIPRRRPVKGTRVLWRRKSTGVVFGRRACIRNVKESAGCSGSEVKSHGLIVGIPIILCVRDFSKAVIRTRWRRAQRQSNQSSGK